MDNLCPRCGATNIAGSLVCAKCNLALVEGLATKQLSMGKDSPLHLTSAGTIKFASHMRLLVHIGEAKLDIKIEEQLTLGRQGQTGKPDIDLSPHGAYDAGVSRWHAVLKRDDQILTVTDNGSANGTWVNGERLKPGAPRVLSDGDTVWLGQLKLDIYFYYT